MAQVKYLKTTTAAVKAVDNILIREKPVIAVKCLGCNVGQKDGRITLVVVGCWDGNVYLFDIRTCPAIMYDGGVLRLIQSAEMLKVFHNCRPDSVTLEKQFDVKIKHFYDTQVAYSIIMEYNGLPPRRLTLEQLCDTYKQPLPAPTRDLQRLLCEDMNAWARRPITKDMLSLAASYVQPLVPALFTLTDSGLPELCNDWFTYQCDVNSRTRRPQTPRRGLKPSGMTGPPSGMVSHCCRCVNCVATMGDMAAQIRNIISREGSDNLSDSKGPYTTAESR